MELQLYQEVALIRSAPETNLQVGDVAVLIDTVPHPAGGEDGAILEVFNAVGESIAIVIVPFSAVAPPARRSSAGSAHLGDFTLMMETL